MEYLGRGSRKILERAQEKDGGRGQEIDHAGKERTGTESTVTVAKEVRGVSVESVAREVSVATVATVVTEGREASVARKVNVAIGRGANEAIEKRNGIGKSMIRKAASDAKKRLFSLCLFGRVRVRVHARVHVRVRLWFVPMF